jgi:heme/copper-type cytochrome/quinol oxidase subunit 4
MKDFILNFFRSKSNESSKRLIAFMFSVTLIVIAFITNSEKILEQIITALSYLIALSLGLNMAENISNIFKKENNHEK